MAKHLRLARLLELLTVIKYHPDWGPKKLARYFEISEKRLYDDLNELNAANIPLVYNGKGYSYLSMSALPPVRFTVDEALALVMCGSMVEGQKDDVYSRLARGAAAKLLELLPEESRRMVMALEGKLSVRGKGSSELNHSLKTLNEAVASRSTVECSYYSYSSGKTTRRKIDPYGLIYRGNSWYLLGGCHNRGEVRTFRVNRMKDLETTGAKFEYPEGFSIEEHVRRSWAVFQGAETDVEVLFSPKLAPLIEEHRWQPDQEIVKREDGSIVFKTRVAGTLEIRRWIMSWGEGVEALWPESLRQEIAGIAAEMAKNHAIVKRIPNGAIKDEAPGAKRRKPRKSK
jgi:predicted DNA-binding transcriptional regulator YafY